MASLVYERENCFAGTHLYNWVERGSAKVGVYCRPRTQHDVLGQGSKNREEWKIESWRKQNVRQYNLGKEIENQNSVQN